ncbi:MAG: hypothetical protein R2757_20075 [Draconibacterium sp.]
MGEEEKLKNVTITMCILHTWVRETQEAGSTQFFPATQCRKPPANRYATCTTVTANIEEK